MKKIFPFFFTFTFVYSLSNTPVSQFNSVVENLSSCNFIKTRYSLVNGANFASPTLDIRSHSTLALDVLFDDSTFSNDDFLAGVSYEISCDNTYSGYIDLKFYVNKIGIKYSSSQIKLQLPSSTNFHNVIFMDA
ncbi:MAG: hypothetical protein VX335_01825 [Pseudomonadota bacterium]|nr:hypothetical protein [Pseudomonadota bacterium]